MGVGAFSFFRAAPRWARSSDTGARTRLPSLNAIRANGGQRTAANVTTLTGGLGRMADGDSHGRSVHVGGRRLADGSQCDDAHKQPWVEWGATLTDGSGLTGINDPNHARRPPHVRH